MQMNSRCIACLLKKQDAKLATENDEQKKLSYMKEVLRILSESQDEETMPWLSTKIDRLYATYFPGNEKPYAKLKKHYNQMMLAMENDLRNLIQSHKDPLAYALQLARVGNYIDFGALDEVDADFFLNLLQKAEQDTVNSEIYQPFLQDLSQASTLLYICDNCGEILLDKLFIEQLKLHYPKLTITAMVRGDEVLNDATMIDAIMVDLPCVCEVIDNGIAMAGTDLTHISPFALSHIQKADLIIAKGQANFETLCGNELPIYYLLLCKCDLFVERFHMPKFQGILYKEVV